MPRGSVSHSRATMKYCFQKGDLSLNESEELKICKNAGKKLTTVKQKLRMRGRANISIA